MTVDELIEKLKYMPLDAEVKLVCAMCDYHTDADGVTLNKSASEVLIS